MASYTLSGEADADIEAIAQNSLESWGFDRADKYVLDLHSSFQTLAEFPNIGLDADHIRPGMMRTASGSHSVFYRKSVDGIVIIRVLTGAWITNGICSTSK